VKIQTTLSTALYSENNVLSNDGRRQSLDG